MGDHDTAHAGERSGAPVLRFQVTAAEAATRLDRLLSERLGVSRARARRLLAMGVVRVGDAEAGMAAKGAPVPAGATVEVRAPAQAADERPPAEPGASLVVLAEGPGWIALDKPPHVPVHPLRPDERGTLLGALLAHRPQVFGVGEGGLRSGVVHRLDLETSGVVLFATEDESWRQLRHAFRTHRLEKRYRALVRGRLAGTGRERVHLAVTQHRPARVRVVAASHPGAREARLAWRALGAGADATLVEVTLETGHLHQIRATFAALGHPVLGDRVYGGDEGAAAPGLARRQLLHAARVALPERGIAAASPDPPDFAAAVAELANASQDGAAWPPSSVSS